jgi:hypothetical protein
MTKKSHKWIDEYEDEFVTDKKHKRKLADRRKRKRMKNALRNCDVDQLTHIEDYDEYY